MKPWDLGWREQADELNRLTGEIREALEEAWLKIEELQAELDGANEEIKRLEGLLGDV